MDRRWHILLFLFGLSLPLGFAALVYSTFENMPLPHYRPSHAPATGTTASAPAAMRRSHSPSPGAFSAWDENRLLDLARRGSTCALLASPLTARAPLTSLYRLFPAASETKVPADVLEAYLNALSARIPADFEAALRSVSHPLLDYTEANAALGLLPGRPDAGRAYGAPHDPRTPSVAAIPLLRSLAEAEPLNAAPSLLLAYALKLAGEPEESARELERALARPLFRTYADEAIESLALRARGKPTLLEAALAIAAKAPGPDLWPVEDFLVDALADADPRVAELGYAFGRRLAAQERSGFSSAFNFGFGQRIANTSWKRLHPLQKAPRALSARPEPVPGDLLAGLSLPLSRGTCEKMLPRLALRLAPAPGRAPALQ